MQPFLQHHHQMVSIALVPMQGGNQSKSLQGGNAPNVNVFMCDHEVNIQIIYHSYDVPPSTLDQLESHPSGSLTIYKPTIEILPHPPKGDLHRTMPNPNARELLITKMLLRKSLKHHVSSLPWRCCNIVLQKERNYCLQLELLIHLM